MQLFSSYQYIKLFIFVLFHRAIRKTMYNIVQKMQEALIFKEKKINTGILLV